MKELRGKVNTVITSTLSLSLSVRATLLCVTLSVSISTWAFFACSAPLSIQSPSFLSPSLFPTPPLPEAKIPHRSHSNVRLSHGAPFLILTSHQPETPHTQPNRQLCFSESRRVGEYLLYHWDYEKTCVDLRGDVRGDETGLSSACQHKINHPLDN